MDIGRDIIYVHCMENISSKINENAKKIILLLSKKNAKEWLPPISIVIILTISFVYGWVFDPSKPVAGIGWADQTLYKSTVDGLLSGNMPTPHQLHFSVGYPLLGAIGGLFLGNQPFFLVSYLLLIGSALLSFYGVKKLFGSFWAILFCVLLFFWDGVGRTFYSASELFVIPWNNQVLFFAMAFYLWLYATQFKKTPSIRLSLTIAAVTGFTLLTREESIIFIMPLLLAYMIYKKLSWKMWIVVFSIIAIIYTPQLIAKQNAFGSILASGRSFNYSAAVTQSYFRPEMLYRNTWEILIDSDKFISKPPHPVIQKWCEELPAGACTPSPLTLMPALLQKYPWLSLGFTGMVYIVASKRFTWYHKVFVIVSISILLFYLSGSNMAWQKLQYHTIRYIAPSFIALNLGIIAVLVLLKKSILSSPLFDNMRKTIGRHK